MAIVATIAFASAAHADEPPATPTPAAPATTPPDVVRLRNGGFLRGTISEVVPGDAVTLVLPTGETRKIPLAETTYVGPASGDPKATPPVVKPTRPYAVIETDTARVKLLGAEDGLTFYLQTRSAGVVGLAGEVARGFDKLCTAPCAVEVPAGNHRFGLSRATSKLVQADDEITLHDGDAVRGAYDSRLGLRIAGAILIPASIAGGIALMYSSAQVSSHQRCTSATDCSQVADVSVPLLALGLGVLFVGSITGIVLVRLRDSATIEVVPGNGATAMPRTLGTPRAAAGGLSARLSF